MAFLGIVALIVWHILLIFLILPLGFAVALILPFVYIMAAIGFMATYAAYPVIERYMIEPYENEQSEVDASDEA